MELNPLYETIIDGLMADKYAIADNFFSADEVRTLRETILRRYNEEQFRKSAIGNHANEQVIDAIRGDFILWMDEEHATAQEGVFFDRINDFMSYMNRTCFMGLAEKEFHYAVYPPGTYYKRHLDTFKNDSRRKLSVVTYLNDENWQPEYGGELTIYVDENGSEKAIDIYPVSGRVVVFESQQLEHEVKPVKRDRLSITGWIKTR
jgi:SM-20-related protein